MSVTADQHFAIIPEWVLYADISAQAIRLYATLRRYADKQGKAHPNRQTLADNMHTSVDTVKRAIKELTDIGALDRGERYDSEGRQTSNQYRVISHPPQGTGAPHGGVTYAPGEGSTGAPRTIAIYEPEPEEPEKYITVGAFFDEFWFAYPRKVRRPYAKAAFVRALRRGVDPLTIVTGAQRLLADPNLPAEEYIPHPATWLNGDGWDDPALPARNGDKPYDNAAEIYRRAMEGGNDGSDASTEPHSLIAGVLSVTEVP